ARSKPLGTPLEIELISVARLADIAAADETFMEVAAVYRGDPAFNVARLVEELVQGEQVPLLPILRYKPPGLRKREQWEETWELQRREDAGETITDIPVPPKYKSSDFITTGGVRYWALRGKLDVPKERWISFPHCPGSDGTLMIAWAGYDHLQQTQSIATHYQTIKEEQGGADDPRLIPLLACIAELLPWLKQWHADLDPNFNLSMADYFEGFLTEEARSQGKTLEEIRAWQPPTAATRRRTRAAKP
ncbi:MAG: SAM-dependent methyltransferase, partial [Planctomycetaceae bacterium]